LVDAPVSEGGSGGFFFQIEVMGQFRSQALRAPDFATSLMTNDVESKT